MIKNNNSQHHQLDHNHRQLFNSTLIPSTTTHANHNESHSPLNHCLDLVSSTHRHQTTTNNNRDFVFLFLHDPSLSSSSSYLSSFPTYVVTQKWPIPHQTWPYLGKANQIQADWLLLHNGGGRKNRQPSQCLPFFI